MVRTWTTVQTMSTTYGGQKPNAHTVEYIRRHHIVPLTPNTLASAFWPPSSSPNNVGELRSILFAHAATDDDDDGLKVIAL